MGTKIFLFEAHQAEVAFRLEPFAANGHVHKHVLRPDGFGHGGGDEKRGRILRLLFVVLGEETDNVVVVAGPLVLVADKVPTVGRQTAPTIRALGSLRLGGVLDPPED